MSRGGIKASRRSRGPAIAGSPRSARRVDRSTRLQLAGLGVAVVLSFIGVAAFAQSAVKVPRVEEKDKAEKAIKKQQEKKAQRTSVIEFRGQAAFKEKELRSILKEQISTIDDYGLTAARGDDAAFFLELFYRKHGYAKVSVRYSIDGDRLLLDINEGPLVTLGLVNFVGNQHESSEVLFDYAVGPTRERYSSMQQKLPFVAADVEEGADLVHRLYIANGYLKAKVDATGNPEAATNGRVPVFVSVTPGPLYHFDGVQVTGLQRLRPSYVTRRFSKFSGQTYSPELVDEKFRELMKSGLFTVLQIKPTPIGGNALRLDISAEEAKSKEVGLALGYGSYTGAIVGASYRDRDLFGYGRPISTLAEWSERGYKWEILWEDPYFFDSDFGFKAKLSALTFDFDGYAKFEQGLRLDLTRQLSKQYEVGLVYSTRHVDVTSADIKPILLGDTSYFVSSIGITQTLDLRDSKVNPNRGFVLDNTFDFANSTIGSNVDFVRSTARFTYFLPIGHEPKPGFPDHRTLLAFGARAGIMHNLKSGGTSPAEIPIDERFFNGGSTTVRSFAERDLGPHNHGHSIGGEFFSVFKSAEAINNVATARA